MLKVLTPTAAWEVILARFGAYRTAEEPVPTEAALHRVLSEDVTAREYVPAFDRSTVDGFAVCASDTFGCSENLPALLALDGEVRMGESAGAPLAHGCCRAIPTGGELPSGADAAVMLEYTERYGGGDIGVTKPVAPGANLIHKGDDAFPGKVILRAGRRLIPADLGALAALGIGEVYVAKKPTVGVISTGDELVPVGETPGAGQVRDVNSALLEAEISAAGGEARLYGVIPDDERAIMAALWRSTEDCDITLLSGGSSVGEKDAAAKLISSVGELLFHGVAMKPGKPAIVGDAGGRPVFGLPGHPAAAHFSAELFVRPLIVSMLGGAFFRKTASARLAEALSSNNGREEYVAVALEGGLARPIRAKSGLITALAGSDGYIVVPRDCEGLSEGAEVSVFLYE
ncbi:MAG: molybdopterin molybdotransferase MoeA [Oscillospiraceae bacterium]